MLTQNDVTTAMEYIQKNASYTDEDGNIHQADIIWGASEKHTLEDDELELVVVATRFADGEQLKIKTAYTDPTKDNPFGEKPEKVTEPEKVTPSRAPINPPKEPVVITPQQDRYKSIGMQKREPAYVRKRATFDDETENVSTTTFIPKAREVESDDNEGVNNGSLFS